ncbi:MAG TPA: TonB-dependent receptor [Myxococcota bacterium]|nr:TonB-dependent receptor [Myxococcota bacterium]
MTPAPVALRARQRGARASGLPSCLLALSLAFAASARAEEPSAPPAYAPGEGQPSVVRETGEVSITATRGERNLLDVPANVTVLDAEDIARSGAANVPELLRREAGLFVTNTTTNPEGYGVEARGFQNGGGNGCRTLVLIDGRRANEPDTGCPDWTFIPLANVERIEIVRGPGSAMYGDNAIGGVISITTRQPGSDGATRASLGARAGSYDSGAVDGALSTSFGALGVGLSGNYGESDGFRVRSDYEERNAQLDLRYDLGDLGNVGLITRYGSNERARPGAIFVDYGTRDGEQASDDISDGVDRERSVAASVAVNLPAEISLRATPHYRRSRSISESVFDPGTLFEFPFHFDDEQESAGVDLQVSRDFDMLGTTLRLIGGGEYRQEEYDSVSRSDFGTTANAAERDLWGLFLQAELTLADDWLFSGGVRYDDSNLEGRLSAPFSECGNSTRCDFEDHEWSPRAALTWRFAEPGALYVSYSEGFRFPNLNEAFGAFGFAPALRPEHSKGFEIGAKWHAERVRAGIGFYQMQVEDEIFFDPLATNPLPGGFDGINTNVEEVRHRGVELSSSYQALEWLELYAAYTFDDVEVRKDSRIAFEGEQLPITPKHRGNVGVRATLPLGFEASVDARYVGERRLVNDVVRPADFLPSYAAYDARVGWSGEIAEQVTLMLEVVGRNLTNRHYAEWGGWNGGFTDVGYFPSPERNFSAGARITFER